jgi:hypothetical protein
LAAARKPASAAIAIRITRASPQSASRSSSDDGRHVIAATTHEETEVTFKTGLLVAAATSLAACGSMEMAQVDGAPTQTGAGSAENACITAVNTNMGARGAAVLSSQPSAAGTIVMLRSADGTNWRCAATSNGVVADLSIV